MVFQHVGILDDTVGIEDDLHVNRLTRISRNIHHVLTLEHITEHRFSSADGANLELAVRLGKAIASRKGFFYSLLLQPTVFLRLQSKAGTKQHDQHQYLPIVEWVRITGFCARRNNHGFTELSIPTE